MKKLTLDLDSLSIESFDPGGAPDALRGTVQGAALSVFDGCGSHNSFCVPQNTTDCT
ncbi:MAG TPA: hypothetical protein VEX86_28085 [Longimicrobium sp.]|nr:hypothetical protein [Longimicrobium sp.]